MTADTAKRVDVERLVELLEEQARLMAIKDSLAYLSHYLKWDANAGNYLLENGRGLAELVATNAALLQQLAERDAEVAEFRRVDKQREEVMLALHAEARNHRQRAEAAERAREWLRSWVCHSGGLLNAWAKEWRPARDGTLTDFIGKRLDAAFLAANGERDGI